MLDNVRDERERFSNDGKGNDHARAPGREGEVRRGLTGEELFKDTEGEANHGNSFPECH